MTKKQQIIIVIFKIAVMRRKPGVQVRKYLGFLLKDRNCAQEKIKCILNFQIACHYRVQRFFSWLSFKNFNTTVPETVPPVFTYLKLTRIVEDKHRIIRGSVNK